MGRPGDGTGPGWRKNKERKFRCDPVIQLTRQDPVKNSVATRWFFFYFIKTILFWFFFKKIIDLNDSVQDLGTRVYKLRVELSFQRDSFVIFVLCRNLGMIPSPWENSAHHWKSPSNEAFVLLWGWHPPAHPILFLCLCWETKRGAKPNGPNSMPFVLVVWYYIPPSSPFYLCSCPKQSGI